MPANQSTKTEQDREFRELDSSISSNLSKREGIRERKRRKQFWGFGVFSWEGLVWNRGKIKEGKEINRKKTAVLLLSKWTCVLILKRVPKVLYLSFAFNKNLRNNAPSRKGTNVDEKDFFFCHHPQTFLILFSLLN